MKKGTKVEPKYPAFSNGTEFMWWQGHNCDRCVKASRYNEKTDEYTKYRCQIQCDIEMASIQDGLVTKRVYDIVQQPICKYLQTERKRYPKRLKAMLNQPNLFEDNPSTDLYDRIQADLRNRNRQRQFAEIDNGIKHIRECCTNEELLRVAYVPFVICRLVWDYTDTIKDLCILLRLSETKKLTRAVRELREAYDRQRVPYIEPSVADSEERNMYVYERKVQGIMSLLTTNIKIAVDREHPDLKEEHRDLLVAVYQCHALLSALVAYTRKQTDYIARKLGWRMGDMLPESVRALRPLILGFAGDCRLVSDQWKATEERFIETFANQMGLIEFTETRHSVADEARHTEAPTEAQLEKLKEKWNG